MFDEWITEDWASPPEILIHLELEGDLAKVSISFSISQDFNTHVQFRTTAQDEDQLKYSKN